jgi:hypothetical protein
MTFVIVLAFSAIVNLLALITSGRGTTQDSGILQFLLGGAAMSAPAGAYAALYSAVPTADNGTFTELAGGGYARATISSSNASSAWSATTTDATGVWKTNSAQISFPQATANWTAASGWGVLDASSAGNIVYWGTFAGPSTVGSGATPSFASGQLKIVEA